MSLLTYSLDPSVDQIPGARRFVVDAVRELGGPIDPGLRQEVELAAGEAITNAVIHAGTTVEVTVEQLDDAFRVSVHDADRAPIPAATLPDGLARPSGRGLAIISALADCWGVQSIEDDGKVLWFVIGPEGSSACDRA